jgi:hypothetical protein
MEWTTTSSYVSTWSNTSTSDLTKNSDKVLFRIYKNKIESFAKTLQNVKDPFQRREYDRISELSRDKSLF